MTFVQTTRSDRLHGGPDATGPVRYDFSSNANSAGPSQIVLDLMRQTDLSHYPDPTYLALREALAQMHGISAARVLMAGSASEFIFRITSFITTQSDRQNIFFKSSDNGPDQIVSVWMPEHAYGDYEAAARAFHLRRAKSYQDASLLWLCDPSSPLGQSVNDIGQIVDRVENEQIAVLDCAYEPLRLVGKLNINPAQLDRLWQLWTPNKALGMTGVRGAYVIAPRGKERLVEMLISIAPSWLIGVDGVTMLKAWVLDDVQSWLESSLITLRQWKSQQVALCHQLGWQSHESISNFFCATHPYFTTEQYLPVLRQFDIKLRDTASFGLANHVRMAVLPLDAQERLREAWIYFEKGLESRSS